MNEIKFPKNLNETGLNQALNYAKSGDKLYVGKQGFVLLQPDDVEGDLVPVTKKALIRLSKNFEAPSDVLIQKCQPFLSRESRKTANLARQYLFTPSPQSKKLLKEVEKNPSYHGTIKTSKAKHLVKHQPSGRYLLSSGRYLLYRSERSSQLKIALQLEGEVIIRDISIRQGKLHIGDESFSKLEALIDALIENPQPIHLMSRSFLQKQLNWNATESTPEKVLEKMQNGSCCITKEADEETFKLSVVENDQMTSYPITLSDQGIEITINDVLFGPVERLHDLFEQRDFPANYIHYERSPAIREEYYYWDLLPKMWNRGSEWVKSRFQGRTFFASDKGITGSRKAGRVAEGGMSKLYALHLHPSSVKAEGEYLVSFSSEKFTSKEFEKRENSHIVEADTIKEIKREFREKGIELKYCLLPTIVEHQYPSKSGKKHVCSVVLRASQGSLEAILEKDELYLSGRYQVTMDILRGIEELDRIIIDLKPGNIVGFSESEENPEIKLIDLGGSFSRDKIPESFFFTPDYISPSIAKRYVQSKETGQPHGIPAEDFEKNHLYAWGAIAYQIFTGDQAHFERETEEDFLQKDSLDLEILVKDDNFANPYSDGRIENVERDDSGKIISVHWKDNIDSAERLIWDAVMWEYATDDGKIAQPLTLKQAQERLRAVAKEELEIDI